MPYTPQTWTDSNSSFPVSAARMGTIETGIQTAQAAAEARVVADGISTAKKMTQAAYDALGTKDAATAYFIVG